MGLDDQPDNAGRPISNRALIESLREGQHFIPCPRMAVLALGTVDLTCGICREDGMRFSRSFCERYEHAPSILPCGHVAGYSCLQRWINNHRSCPFCRLQLEYELCPHVMQPRILDRVSIHTLPRTLPEGGRIGYQCADCRLRTGVNCAETLWAVNRADLSRALADFLRTGSDEHLARIWKLKQMVESLHDGCFEDGRIIRQW